MNLKIQFSYLYIPYTNILILIFLENFTFFSIGPLFQHDAYAIKWNED